jgi:protein O-GlcNAc transferase
MTASSAAGLLEQALALQRRGALADAAARYAEVLDADPNNSDAHYYLGLMSCQQGRFAEGIDLARKSLASDPRNARAQVLLGRALAAIGRHQEALVCFDQVIALSPDFAQAHSSRADLLADLGRATAAIEGYDRALHLAPDAAEDWFNRAVALCMLGRMEDAIASLDAAIQRRPNVAQVHLLRSKILADLGRYDEALVSLDETLRVEPRSAEAWLGKASLLKELKRYGESLDASNNALAMRSDYAEAFLCRGNVMFVLQRYDEALAACDQALALKPDLAEAWFGRGAVLFTRKQRESALEAYMKALELRRDYAEAAVGCGNVFMEMKEYEKSLAAYDQALSLRRDFAEAWAGRGIASVELQRHEEALAACDRALALNADLSEAWLGRGNAYFAHKDYQNALRAYQRVLELSPDLAPGYLMYANTLFELDEPAQALAAYDKAIALDSDSKYADGQRLYMKLILADWTTLETLTNELLSKLRRGQGVRVPFTLLPLPATAMDQSRGAEAFVSDQPSFPPVWRNEIYSHDRIRVCYLSADFREHPVSYLTAGMFEYHDRSNFEITCLSLGSEPNSPTRKRIESATERFLDVQDRSDAEIAALIRGLEIDILVDLIGHTHNGRLGILTRRPAPVQVHYLGYAGTLGSRLIDYILADPTVIPEDQRHCYAEQVVWLPDSYLVCDNRRAISAYTPTRHECGLAEETFVFCSFNNVYKIAPDVFRIWMRLLQATPRAVLWLSRMRPAAMTNLRREAERCGVAGHRLIFAPRLAQNADHLARQRQADLFLDTLPYNAHTTASDALWAGLPVVTCLGQTFAGRVAASLLKAIGLPELITTSLTDYEALALKLAHEPATLAAIKERLARNRDRYPLFDTPRFTRNLEAAYVSMWQRYQRGEPPKALAVNSMELRRNLRLGH